MSRIGRTVARLVLAALACTVVVAAPGAVAVAADDEYVKYYAVQARYSGKPETLNAIAGRFLGDTARSGEIFNLNAGRKQPDGGRLSSADRLTAGWYLVLPWDAVGSGVKYGVLPTRAPQNPPPPPPKSKEKSKAKPRPNPPPPPAAALPGVPSSGSRPSVAPSGSAPAPGAAPGTTCTTAAASSTKSDWARLRLAAEKAWPQSKGKAQLVAVVDSGVNGALPQLAGHVTVGVDMLRPDQRGDSDCLGTGTAMAALVVARQTKGQGPMGAAPEATVLPIKIVDREPQATPDVQARAIETAVKTGATVIALGAYVDGTDPAVAKAIADAVGRNVVVVLSAPLDGRPVQPQEARGDGILRVAGVGVDLQTAVNYRKGAVDVSAPGVNVTSLGATANGGTGTPVAGSGTHYAVAYTAAVAALVRAAYPDLDAKQVAHRVVATAESMSDGDQPSAQYGHGLINPSDAVTKVLPEEAEAGAGAPQGEAGATEAAVETSFEGGEKSSGGRAVVLIIAVLLMIGAAALLVNRIRKLLRGGGGDEDKVVVEREDPELDLYGSRYGSLAHTGPAYDPGPPTVPLAAAGPVAVVERAPDDDEPADWDTVDGDTRP